MRQRIAFFLSLVTILLSTGELSAALIEYDRGAKGARPVGARPVGARPEGTRPEGVRPGGKERDYRPATECMLTPCIMTQWGTIRLPKDLEKTHTVQMGALHRGLYTSIALFQQSTTFEQKLSGRLFARQPNRNILNLERLIDTGKTKTIYLYGLLLQHELDEGDLIALTLTPKDSREKVEDYYFRYHHDGMKADIDIAFVQPINLFNPNPGGIIQAAYSTAALSFSLARAPDPEKQYRFISKLTRAVRFNLILGFLLRKDVGPFGGDNITQEFFDGFGGLGFTFFDFLAVGYGANFIRSPHTSFPFVGIEVRHLFEFIRSLKADTHSRWQRYLKEEIAHAPESSDSSTR